MGQNSGQRRADRARKRARRSNGPNGSRVRSSGEAGSFRSENEGPQDCNCLGCQVAEDTDEAWADAANRLIVMIGFLWTGGWQPSELVRQVRRAVSREAAQLVTLGILVDDRRRPVESKHPRWQQQIDGLRSATPVASLVDDWMERWVEATPDPVEIVDALMPELVGLGSLHRLVPPPGETVVDVASATDDGDDPILAQVRALLAQAESTSFPAEAETFTAKAQSIMSRHAIDEAMVRHAAGDSGRPVTVRLSIDDPYAGEKAMLLHVVADAGRCRAIGLGRYAMSMLIGQATDIRRVELLFTSLLLQAQGALNHEATSGHAGSHRRSRGFRSAFLAGYAQRIGDRLVSEREQAEAGAGADILPVLARQSQAVDDEIDRLFGGRLTFRGSRSRDRAGWSAGGDAADRAHLRESGVGSGSDRAGGGELGSRR